jgi:hypothetical protein
VFVAAVGLTSPVYADDPGLRYIPSTGNLISTIFYGTANQARYADLAENYLADEDYPPGTVLEFGGLQEVTITRVSHTPRVAGVVSTEPGYLMNADLTGDYVINLALTGRVPCRVVGKIEKGDRLVSSNMPGVAMTMVTSEYLPGSIVGKALEEYNSDQIGIITIAVGKN